MMFNIQRKVFAVICLLMCVFVVFAQNTEQVSQDTTINGVLKSSLDRYIQDYFQLTYLMVLWIVGAVIKKFGEQLPILRLLPNTTYRVLAYAILAAVGFAVYKNSIGDYLKMYAIGTSVYELILTWVFAWIGNVVKGYLGKEGETIELPMQSDVAQFHKDE